MAFAGVASEAVEPWLLQARLGLAATRQGASEATDGAVRCRLAWRSILSS
jgi:hypothetical protein